MAALVGASEIVPVWGIANRFRFGANPSALRYGQVCVRDDSGVLYFRKYGNTTHMVVTSAEGVFLKQAIYDSGLVTQYPQDLREKEFPNAIVDNIR